MPKHGKYVKSGCSVRAAHHQPVVKSGDQSHSLYFVILASHCVFVLDSFVSRLCSTLMSTCFQGSCDAVSACHRVCESTATAWGKGAPTTSPRESSSVLGQFTYQLRAADRSPFFNDARSFKRTGRPGRLCSGNWPT